MRQYTVGDMVLYSVHGICRIEDKTQRDFGGQKQEYYMLKPVYTHRQRSSDDFPSAWTYHVGYLV